MQSALSEAELEQLGDLLDDLPSQEAMNLEMADGFFAALIAGPEHPQASEYLPRVYGAPEGESTPPFADEEKSQRIAALLQRHWDAMAQQFFGLLEKDEVYVPLMAVDERDQAIGNEWAIGFMIGTGMRFESWQALYEDEDEEGLLTPMLLLAHENHPDAEVRTPPISDARRQELIEDMAWNVTLINRYFADERLTGGKPRVPVTRESPKVGRNDPCPCGSGKKFKQCCGSPERLH